MSTSEGTNMEWFTGGIPEAIASVKAKKGIFVVYVHDSSENSKTTEESLESQAVSSTLNSDKFVAMKIENGTETAKQFSQIYPLVVIPSIYFISGETGVPLEVLGGAHTPEGIKEKLNGLIAQDKKDEVSNPSPNEEQEDNSMQDDEEQAPGPSSSKEDMMVTEPVVESEKDENVSVNSNEETSNMGEEGTSEVADLESSGGAVETDRPLERPLEECVERARELIAQKQVEKEEEKREEEKRKEIERRKMGQEIGKRKQKQQQEEFQAMALERKKEKEQDKLARERVRAQIAADRAEREARSAMLREEQQAASAPNQSAPAAAATSSSSVSNSDISRLKFRLPDGSSHFGKFSADSTLKDVENYIKVNIDLPYSNFIMSSTVQLRPFTMEDMGSTLRDLSLVPSAIIILYPAASRSGGGSSVSRWNGGFMDLIRFVLTPITIIVRTVLQFLGLTGPPRTPTRDTDGEPVNKRLREEAGGSATTRNRPQTAYGSRGDGRFQRDGNVLRLQADDDDDENNTWNGNSTQQM
ncbi:UBX domain-containing protein 4 isoform X2 [Oratosquilla oratoria]|uniref:UBX domain-containing protein 4 isoform X2 n=1 Tax=Oratosquilla oratoria TaxID=337810 RepID=UPI003F75ED22